MSLQEYYPLRETDIVILHSEALKCWNGGDITEEIIGMEDMKAIYEVTDYFGIDREIITVPLAKKGSGSVIGCDGENLEIVLPSIISTRDWLPVLESKLIAMGLRPDIDDDWSS